MSNQIGIIEVQTEYTATKKKKPTKVAKGNDGGVKYQIDILAIIAARNENEEKRGSLIQEFESKIQDFFEYVRNTSEGQRLIIKLNSHVEEGEIYDDFGKIYRRYKALNRQKVGDYFFKEMDDLINKLCDDFEKSLKE